eukprot:TRINITY_DN2634_c0_g1_i2.p1 TRINITY_DN2634_c0_g1~~TRINITY_DN2634_c0_g1_i2.p1  ORF type:complete len:408 (+),score=110.03 TRINITY_DN2634_c0_g1_i2:27-1250(+)
MEKIGYYVLILLLTVSVVCSTQEDEEFIRVNVEDNPDVNVKIYDEHGQEWDPEIAKKKEEVFKELEKLYKGGNIKAFFDRIKLMTKSEVSILETTDTKFSKITVITDITDPKKPIPMQEHQRRKFDILQESIKNDKYAVMMHGILRDPKYELKVAIDIDHEAVRNRDGSIDLYGLDNYWLSEFSDIIQHFIRGPIDVEGAYELQMVDLLLSFYNEERPLKGFWDDLMFHKEFEKFSALYAHFLNIYDEWKENGIPEEIEQFDEYKLNEFDKSEWFYMLKFMVIDILRKSTEHIEFPTQKLLDWIESVKLDDHAGALETWLMVNQYFDVLLRNNLVVSSIGELLEKIESDKHVIIIITPVSHEEVLKAINTGYGLSSSNWAPVDLKDFDCNVLKYVDGCDEDEEKNDL